MKMKSGGVWKTKKSNSFKINYKHSIYLSLTAFFQLSLSFIHQIINIYAFCPFDSVLTKDAQLFMLIVFLN